MLLKLEIFDANKRFRGTCDLGLDWSGNTWVRISDPFGIWERVTYAKDGPLEPRGGGELGIAEPLFGEFIVVKNAPRSETDVGRAGGDAEITDPYDDTFKGGRIHWSATSTGSLPGASTTPVLSARRQQLLKRLRELLPCTYGSKNYNVLAFGAKKGATKTNCYMLPGFVAYELGTQGMKPAEAEQYMKRRSLNGMSLIRTRGIQMNAWVTADLVKRPLPGDVYGLLYWDKTDLDGDFSHVGVIESAVGTEWRTADFGQGGGWDGVRDFARTYDPGKGTLTGAGTRVLGGWVDIDKYFG